MVNILHKTIPYYQKLVIKTCSDQYSQYTKFPDIEKTIPNAWFTGMTQAKAQHTQTQ